MPEQSQNQNRSRNRKNKPKRDGRKPRREYRQVFGPGMMVTHEELGLGVVTSAFKWHICVKFFMTDATETVNARELRFTREEQGRRRKIGGALHHGRPLACAPSDVGQHVVHELMGFGMVKAVTDEKKVVVSFTDNDYIDHPVDVEPSELRIVVPREKPAEPEKKRRRR